MEEKAQTQKEISELRYELEKTHQAKAEALVSREKNAIERLQKQQEVKFQILVLNLVQSDCESIKLFFYLWQVYLQFLLSLLVKSWNLLLSS